MTEVINTLLYGADGAFVWGEHIGDIIITALLSMVPAFEGRYALVASKAADSGMPLAPLFLIAVVFSTLPMPFLLLLLRPILDWMYTWKIGFVRKFAAWVDARAERKSKKVEARGLIGLYLFVAVPLPGTGVWTGSAIASVLKMNRKRAAIVIFLGNVTACLIMATLTYLGIELFS